MTIPKSSVRLVIPTDDELLKAAGRVAFAHAQLELSLRYTVKTLTGMSIDEALDATDAMKAYELRDKIKGLFRQKTKDEVAKTKLDALLNKTKRLSEQRNKFIHRALAQDAQGQWVMKDERHAWGPPPSVGELNQLADEIAQVFNELNKARLHGFINEVSKQEVKN